MELSLGRLTMLIMADEQPQNAARLIAVNHPSPAVTDAKPVRPSTAGSIWWRKLRETVAARSRSNWWWHRLGTGEKVLTVIGVLTLVVCTLAIPGVMEWLHPKKGASVVGSAAASKSTEKPSDNQAVKIPPVASPQIYALPTLAVPEEYYAPKVIYPPILIKRVEPIYPPLALKKKMEGDVEVDIDIGKDGSVDHLKAWLGDPVFIDAATAAVKQWKYNPYVENGKAEKVSTSTTIKFRLPTKSRK